MLDACDIRYQTGLSDPDPDTGTQTPVYTTRFSTPCRVKVGQGLAVQDAEAGGRTVVTVRRELHIPVGSAAVEPLDIAVMTSVHATSDPTLAGATLILDGPAPGSQTTARRLQVSEVLT
jgi:hypothetical protein